MVSIRTVFWGRGSRTSSSLFEQDVLRLQVAMDQSRFVEKAETVQELLGEDANQGGAETAELILFDQLIQIDAE